MCDNKQGERGVLNEFRCLMNMEYRGVVEPPEPYREENYYHAIEHLVGKNSRRDSVLNRNVTFRGIRFGNFDASRLNSWHRSQSTKIKRKRLLLTAFEYRSLW